MQVNARVARYLSAGAELVFTYFTMRVAQLKHLRGESRAKPRLAPVFFSRLDPYDGRLIAPLIILVYSLLVPADLFIGCTHEHTRSFSVLEETVPTFPLGHVLVGSRA